MNSFAYGSNLADPGALPPGRDKPAIREIESMAGQGVVTQLTARIRTTTAEERADQ